MSSFRGFRHPHRWAKTESTNSPPPRGSEPQEATVLSIMMESATTTAATRETGAPARSDVIACIPHLRAFAIVLAGDRQRADDLVSDTIVHAFTVAKRPRAGIGLKVQMFAALRRLHFSALGSPSDAALERESRAAEEDGRDSGRLVRIFGRLGDEHREALILAVAGGLSYAQAAEICDCRIGAFRSRVLEAKREISRMLREASPDEKVDFEMLADERAR
jgi:RNA polymerase sigma-70 factor (ECF subfamily)